MPFNGSGTFTLVAGTPYVTGTTISSTVANNLNSDFANNGFSNCLTRDGQSTPTANLPLGGFKLTGLGAGTAVADAPRVSQVQNSAFNTLASVSGVTTITGAASVTPAAYAEGQTFSLLALGANAASPTLNVSSLGAVPIFWNGATCTSSMWATATRLDLTYIATSSQTGFHVMGHSGFMPVNLLRLRGSIATGNGSGGAEISAPSADDQIWVSTASASAGGAFKAFSTVLTGALGGVTSFLTNSIAADVTCDNTGAYFTGPTVAQGTSGTWFAAGTVTVKDTVGAAVFDVKLWDGTTVIDSARGFHPNVGGAHVAISLSGAIASPAGNIRISVNDPTSTSGFIVANATGLGKDSTITVFRIG